VTENQASINTTSPKIKSVSSQERSVLVGEMIVVNGHGVNLTLLKQRFSEGGYQVQETPHFLLFTRSEAPTTILVHVFSSEEMNADIKHFLMHELKPLGLIKESRDFGMLLAGIVGSFFPDDIRSAWHGYGAKTLQRFLLFLSTCRTPTRPPFDFYATIGAFTTLYQRVCELCVGESFLDAGCESGFLPLIIAERMPFMFRIVGVDIRPDMFTVVRELAEERHLSNVQFVQADLLADDLGQLGQFDTVTALAVIEHFSQKEMYQVLANLLRVTTHRLILTVPYEEEAEVIYEHKQTFTRKKLEEVGQWCLREIEGMGRIWCEDCDGGLLLVERVPSALARKRGGIS
jgi:SAM-dependent methyltransferase